ncbi:phosphotransferase [Pseudoalteromonas rubra]|uniref:Kinase n=1 Tax=Pseudoalteromonas rubra TaxID=43658 RepID=A0A5S3X4F2_9GAMM|nr:phosphotransferase [Pseudoalteromonas rubra]TMP39467.1 kinase [Pseudoalteromonas rubra]
MSVSTLVSHVMTMLPDSQHSKALWSGCGHIYKFSYQGDMLVAKVASVPAQLDHRHITQSEHSLNRKHRSYEKELMFYRDTAHSYAIECALPEAKAFANRDEAFVFVFTDFETQGYRNVSKAEPTHVTQMVAWLARFHAIGLVSSCAPKVYGRGNYWHLGTRPDEYERMMPGLLKSSANQIDQRLRDCPYQTLIHGDAKLANFAFSRNQALGYDFQHIGQGIGVADVMLLLTSLYCGRDLELHAEHYLNLYFEHLSEALAPSWPLELFNDLEKSWRKLWTFVWADFHRFLLGWKPDHEKLTSYMLLQTELCLAQLREE